MGEPNILLSRILVPVLGIVVWACYYVNARLAYHFPRGTRKLLWQMALAAAPIFIGVLQVCILETFSPEDAYGGYFVAFLFIEAGGAVTILFSTLFRERTRTRARTLTGRVEA